MSQYIFITVISYQHLSLAHQSVLLLVNLWPMLLVNLFINASYHVCWSLPHLCSSPLLVINHLIQSLLFNLFTADCSSVHTTLSIFSAQYTCQSAHPHLKTLLINATSHQKYLSNWTCHQVSSSIAYANQICSYPCLERTPLQLHLYKYFKPVACCCRIRFAVFGWRSCTEVQGAPVAAKTLYHHCTYASLSTSSRN